MKYTNIDNANVRIKQLEKENAKLKQKHENGKKASELWRRSYFESAAKVRELEKQNAELKQAADNWEHNKWLIEKILDIKEDHNENKCIDKH